MAWIESHQAVGQHPKTIALAQQLGISMPTAVGHLHYLWWWALDYAPDGELKRHSPAIIAHACLWRGKPERFWSALVEAGFIEATETGAQIHDWEEYAGKLIDRRAYNRQRMRDARAVHSAPDVQSTSGQRAELPGSDARADLPDQPDHTGPTGPENPPTPLARGSGRRSKNGVDPEQRMSFPKGVQP